MFYQAAIVSALIVMRNPQPVVLNA